jgi:hypothetical protein
MMNWSIILIINNKVLKENHCMPLLSDHVVFIIQNAVALEGYYNILLVIIWYHHMKYEITM